LLTHVFRNFSGDFVTAGRTLKRRVGEKAASRKFSLFLPFCSLSISIIALD